MRFDKIVTQLDELMNGGWDPIKLNAVRNDLLKISKNQGRVELANVLNLVMDAADIWRAVNVDGTKIDRHIKMSQDAVFRALNDWAKTYT